MKSLAHPQERDDIFRRLKGIGPESTRRWGRMSAHEMVCHVSDAFRMALKERPVADMHTVVTTTLLKWVAFYAPLRWPHGVATMPEVDPQSEGTAPGPFADDRAELERLIARFCEGERHGEHPIFGPLTHGQWMRWGYLHTDHHLRQFGA